MSAFQIRSVPEIPQIHDSITVEPVDLSKRQRRLPFRLYRATIANVAGKPLSLLVRREDQAPNEQGDFFTVYPEDSLDGFIAVEIETTAASANQETLIARVAALALQQQ